MKGYKVQRRRNFMLDKIARTKILLVVEIWELQQCNHMGFYGFGDKSKGSFRKRKKQFKNYCRKQLHCDVVFLKYMGDEAYEVWNTGKHQYTKVE
jgi:hypothetical protein